MTENTDGTAREIDSSWWVQHDLIVQERGLGGLGFFDNIDYFVSYALRSKRGDDREASRDMAQSMIMYPDLELVLGHEDASAMPVAEILKYREHMIDNMSGDDRVRNVTMMIACQGVAEIYTRERLKKNVSKTPKIYDCAKEYIMGAPETIAKFLKREGVMERLTEKCFYQYWAGLKLRETLDRGSGK